MGRVRTACLSFLVMFVASCANVDHATSPTPALQNVLLAQDNLGERVAKDLNRRYLDVRENCGSASAPAFLCSGVLLRGTRQSPNYKVWNNSPRSIDKGGVSFSYLRRDADFNKLAYGYSNGYIFMPIIGGDRTKMDPEILCSFPFDAWTDNRAGTGCGAYPDTAKSDLCRIEKIYTADEWFTAYNAIPLNQLGGRQCGFDVDDDQNHAAGPAFTASLQARVKMGDGGFSRHNEMLIRTWPENIGSTLPLEAFFYLEGSSAGLAEAKYNQQDLKDTDGVVIPIIQLRLPTAESRPAYRPDAPALFVYLPADQVVPIPSEVLSIDESRMVLNGAVAYVNWPLSGTDIAKNTAVRAPIDGRQPYTYTSSNPAIASVTSEGKVQGRANGTARIVVTDGYNKSVSYEVSVSNIYNLVISEQTMTGPEAVAWIAAKGAVGRWVAQPLAASVARMYTRPLPSGGTGWLAWDYGDKYVFCTPSGTIAGQWGSEKFRVWAFVPRNG